MTDVFSKSKRSEIMSKIRSKNSAIEKKVKKILGKDFVHQPKLYGRPDFANSKNKIAVFVDSCFWHKCPKHQTMPKTNRKFWKNKLNKNALRDLEVSKNYLSSGWKVRRIWEHDLKNI
ncbi:MAG: very short patch repair endonuclease [Nanoarchaeota archaeon]